MKSTEDLIRSAIEQTAAQIRPGDLGPLRLETRPVALLRPGGDTTTGRPRFARGLAALGAAAAVLALIGGSLGIASVLRHSRSTEATRQPTPSVRSYLVELVPVPRNGESAPREAVVVNSRTGKVTATFAPPSPGLSFDTVTGSADDRTFVLVAQRNVNDPKGSAKFFKLTVNPASGKARISALPLRLPTTFHGGTLALSPDGTKLAVDSGRAALTRHAHSTVWSYSLVSGQLRSWHVQGVLTFGSWNAEEMSWSDNDKTLACTVYGTDLRSVVSYLLDTAKPGSDLIANSRVLINRIGGGIDIWGGALLTPDGKLFIGAANPRNSPRGKVQEVSTSTRKIKTIVLPRTKLGNQVSVLWLNRTGSTMIVEYHSPKTDLHEIFVFSHGKLWLVRGTPERIPPYFVAW